MALIQVSLPDEYGYVSIGVGKALQERMTGYAKARGLRGFPAVVLAENPKTVNLAKRACNNVLFKSPGIPYEVTMLFD